MQNRTPAAPLRAWFNNLPIQDPIDRHMAVLLQTLLLGLIVVMVLAGLLNLMFESDVSLWPTVLLQSLISIIVTAIPLAMVRRGYFRGAAILVIVLLLLTEAVMISIADLRSVAETLSFFTLAIILAGSLLRGRTVWLTFLFSVAAVLFRVLREPDLVAQVDALIIAANFILLNGLISLFLDRFGGSLHAALRDSLDREIDLENEINIRKRTEAALQHSGDQLEILHEIDRALLSARSLREIADDALVRIRRLIPCARASVTLFDLSKQEASFLAAHFHEPVIFPETPITFQEFGQRIIDTLQENQPWVVANILEDPQATELDKQLVTENGIYAWLSLPLCYQGQLIGSLNLGRGLGQPFTGEDAEIAHDVANQLAIALQQTNLYNALQNELAERKKLIFELETKNAELERFTYTVSHDLRNPLVTIKGFVGMLEKDLREGKDEKVASHLQRIENAADKMHSLLKDLLELSRIGRIANPSEEVNLSQVVSEAIESLDARLRSRKVTVHCPLELPTVFGDRIRLREVFENLIDNAAKYTGNQPEPMIEIGTRMDADGTVFFVKDNGMGIEPQYQKKVFGLFDKLDPASEGTGIGLALIKRIIEVHGGKIWVESEGLGKGSTFCFTMPGATATKSHALS